MCYPSGSRCPAVRLRGQAGPLDSNLMRRRATIAEVAKKARVAVSTVSRVLNGGYVSAEAKLLVESAIGELGYTPSRTARNLKMGKAGCIGVVVETTQGPWFMELLGGIEEELVGRDFSVLLSSLNLRGTFDTTAVSSWIREQRVDGLIFATARKRERALVRAAEAARLPLVFVAPDQNFASGTIIRSRNREAGLEIAAHLLELQHRRIAFVGGPEESVDTQERLRGLTLGLATRAVSLPDKSISFSGSYGPEGGTEFAKKWLEIQRRHAPTAVVLANDSLALGFMLTLQQNGVRIPDEVSVVGFDGTDFGGLVWPRLTSARQQTRGMGIAACKAVLHQIEHGEPSSTAPTEFATELVLRESTGPAPR